MPLVKRKARVDTAMINGFGFGGQNAVAIFRRFVELAWGSRPGPAPGADTPASAAERTCAAGPVGAHPYRGRSARGRGPLEPHSTRRVRREPFATGPRRGRAGLGRAGLLRDRLDRAVAATGDVLGRSGGATTAFDDIELDLGARAEWDRRIFAGVRQVPTRSRHELRPPGASHRITGCGARASGGAVGRNPIGSPIPCHRVIAGDGSIGGYGGDWWGGRQRLLEIKRELLEREGVILPATAFVG